MLARLDENGCFEHHQIAVRIEKDCHKAQYMESTKAVPDSKSELVNAKDGFCVLESCVTVDRSTMRSAIQNRDCVQWVSRKTLAGLQISIGAFTSLSDQVKRHSSTLRAAEAGVP